MAFVLKNELKIQVTKTVDNENTVQVVILITNVYQNAGSVHLEKADLFVQQGHDLTISVLLIVCFTC